MSQFVFEALDEQGQKVRKEIEAPSRDGAISKIKAMGMKPTAIRERRASGRESARTSRRGPAQRPSARQPGAAVSQRKGAERGASAGAATKKRPRVWGGVNLQEITQFTNQLATLQDAGLPLVRSLRILEGQMKPSRLKYTIEDVAGEVESGSTLSDSLSKHPKVFDRLYVNMIKAGEAGGVLDTILTRLSEFMEKSLRLRKKVMGAMIYPAVVMSVAALIVGGIMKYVVPNFLAMFDELRLEKPTMTVMLQSFSNFIGQFWYALLVLPLILYVIYRLIVRSSGGRFQVDRIKINLPLFGMILRKSTVARFCRTLGTLSAAGVSILEALAIVKETTGNAVVTQAVDNVYSSIKEGESIARPLGASGVFDDIVVNMVDIGEETGELDKMLMKVADNYEADVDVAVESLTSIIEPLLIVFLGGAVGFIVVALFLPLINILEGIGG